LFQLPSSEQRSPDFNDIQDEEDEEEDGQVDEPNIFADLFDQERIRFEMPWFYQFCPASKIEIDDSAVYIGNFRLPRFLIFNFSRMPLDILTILLYQGATYHYSFLFFTLIDGSGLECVHYWDRAAHPERDLYQLKTKAVVQDARAAFMERSNLSESHSDGNSAPLPSVIGDNDPTNVLEETVTSFQTLMKDVREQFEEDRMYSGIFRHRDSTFNSSSYSPLSVHPQSCS
jgi:hypothetical protein